MKLKHLFENKMTAEQAYKLATRKGTQLPKYEDIIAKDILYAYLYAKDSIEGRFPAGEPTIAEDRGYAYMYAKDIIKGRFPASEPKIAEDSYYAYWYARDIIKGRFPAGEPAIAKHSQYACYYARDIIEGRWPAGEPAIAKNSGYAYQYAKNSIKGRFPAGEPKIAKHSGYAYQYARDSIKGRFPAGEPKIAEDSYYAYLYKLFLYDNDINFDDLEQQPSEKGPLVVDEHIISNIPNQVKDSQLIKLMKLSFPEVEDNEIVEFLQSKQQSSKGNLPVVTWKEYMDNNEWKYKPQENDFS